MDSAFCSGATTACFTKEAAPLYVATGATTAMIHMHDSVAPRMQQGTPSHAAQHMHTAGYIDPAVVAKAALDARSQETAALAELVRERERTLALEALVIQLRAEYCATKAGATNREEGCSQRVIWLQGSTEN